MVLGTIEDLAQPVIGPPGEAEQTAVGSIPRQFDDEPGGGFVDDPVGTAGATVELGLQTNPFTAGHAWLGRIGAESTSRQFDDEPGGGFADVAGGVAGGVFGTIGSAISSFVLSPAGAIVTLVVLFFAFIAVGGDVEQLQGDQ